MGVETKVTVKEEVTTVKAEAAAAIKAGSTEIKAEKAVEMQVEKNGQLDIQKPKITSITPKLGVGGSNAEGEASGNDISVAAHYEAFGLEAGIDLDKLGKFGNALQEHLDQAMNDFVNKLIPLPNNEKFSGSNK